MDVLCDLAAHPREVRRREDLLDSVWGAGTFVSEEVLSRAISELRRLLEDSAQAPRMIETIRGRGYRLIAEVGPETAAETQQHRASHGWLRFAVLASLLVAAAAGWLWWNSRPTSEPGTNPVVALAVLPIDDLSEGRVESHFGFGVTEALTAQLARSAPFRVISRTSAMRFRDTDLRVPEIAKQLGADVLVEGSVLREDDHLSLTLQLIDGQTDHHLWAETYEAEIGDVLSLYQEAARAIGRQLKSAKAFSGASATTVSAEAYDAYSRGRYLWQQGTRDSLTQSVEAFREALDADASYAQAYAGLADSYILMGIYEMLSPDAAYTEARRWTLEALTLDPGLGEAHTALGAIRLFHEWDFERAEASFLRALELNPNHPIAYLGYHDLLAILNRQDEALAAIEQAVRIDPLNPILVKVLADSIHYVGRTGEALETFDKLIAIHPRFLPAYSHQARLWLETGEPNEARGVIARAEEVFSAPVGQSEAFASVQANLGELGPAHRALVAMDESTDFVSPGRRIRIHIALGDFDSAFEWLHLDVDSRGKDALWCASSGFCEPLATDSRMEALLARVNLKPPARVDTGDAPAGGKE